MEMRFVWNCKQSSIGHLKNIESDCSQSVAMMQFKNHFQHDDVIKWKHFLRYWLFVPGIHWSPVNSPRKGALMFSLICAWINSWVNNREADDLRCYCAHYDVIVMSLKNHHHLNWFMTILHDLSSTMVKWSYELWFHWIIRDFTNQTKAWNQILLSWSFDD